MPHLTLEFSANLRDDPDFASHSDFKTLCATLAVCLAAIHDGDKKVYPIGGIRVRAFATEAYHIADGASDAAFVHATLKIGAGRSAAIKKRTGDALFDLIQTHFAPLYQKKGLALSLEIIESNDATSWKQNNLHTRFP